MSEYHWGGGNIRPAHCKIMVDNSSSFTMSSGESELFSRTKGTAHTLGLVALAADFGIDRGGESVLTQAPCSALFTEKASGGYGP